MKSNVVKKMRPPTLRKVLLFGLEGVGKTTFIDTIIDRLHTDIYRRGKHKVVCSNIGVFVCLAMPDIAHSMDSDMSYFASVIERLNPDLVLFIVRQGRGYGNVGTETKYFSRVIDIVRGKEIRVVITHVGQTIGRSHEDDLMQARILHRDICSKLGLSCELLPFGLSTITEDVRASLSLCTSSRLDVSEYSNLLDEEVKPHTSIKINESLLASGAGTCSSKNNTIHVIVVIAGLATVCAIFWIATSY